MRTPSHIRKTGLVTCGFSSSLESPQRMRGKAAQCVRQRPQARITPAHAGKSRCSCVPSCALRDHPRACGEKWLASDAISVRPGSPPRMRGKAGVHVCHLARCGITPAHAGKSGLHPTLSASARDHPRACGEKGNSSMIDDNKQGSPPRMRGKVRVVQQVPARLGITPAHAGKSCVNLVARLVNRDHPRACGEKRLVSISTVCPAGSPPRMRGKAKYIEALTDGDGITPAHAGKSRPFFILPRCYWDHPRACGEKFPIACVCILFWGSPPRMRGKVERINGGEQCHGITPAHAGKS